MFISGLFVGVVVGVTMMCIVQINKGENDMGKTITFDYMQQMEEDLNEHGSRVMTLREWLYFKRHTELSCHLYDVEGNDDLVRVVVI